MARFFNPLEVQRLPQFNPFPPEVLNQAFSNYDRLQREGLETYTRFKEARNQALESVDPTRRAIVQQEWDRLQGGIENVIRDGNYMYATPALTRTAINFRDSIQPYLQEGRYVKEFNDRYNAAFAQGLATENDRYALTEAMQRGPVLESLPFMARRNWSEYLTPYLRTLNPNADASQTVSEDDKWIISTMSKELGRNRIEQGLAAIVLNDNVFKYELQNDWNAMLRNNPQLANDPQAFNRFKLEQVNQRIQGITDLNAYRQSATQMAAQPYTQLGYQADLQDRNATRSDQRQLSNTTTLEQLRSTLRLFEGNQEFQNQLALLYAKGEIDQANALIQAEMSNRNGGRNSGSGGASDAPGILSGAPVAAGQDINIGTFNDVFRESRENPEMRRALAGSISEYYRTNREIKGILGNIPLDRFQTFVRRLSDVTRGVTIQNLSTGSQLLGPSSAEGRTLRREFGNDFDRLYAAFNKWKTDTPNIHRNVDAYRVEATTPEQRTRMNDFIRGLNANDVLINGQIPEEVYDDLGLENMFGRNEGNPERVTRALLPHLKDITRVGSDGTFIGVFETENERFTLPLRTDNTEQGRAFTRSFIENTVSNTAARNYDFFDYSPPTDRFSNPPNIEGVWLRTNPNGSITAKARGRGRTNSALYITNNILIENARSNGRINGNEEGAVTEAAGFVYDQLRHFNPEISSRISRQAFIDVAFNRGTAAHRREYTSLIGSNNGRIQFRNPADAIRISQNLNQILHGR